MENIILFSVIVALVSALMTLPIINIKGDNSKEKKINQTKLTVLTLVLLLPLIFIFYYLTNFDRNLSSLWPLLILITAIGALFANGKERTVKAFLFGASLLVGVYFLSAFVFNADEKFEQAKMEEQIEITAFDENQTPASVPPQYARNKMKKSFGQVPNTSFYQLGNLQIQKIGGEYVYIAPVEFSGLFRWIKGKQTPGYFTLSATDSSANPIFIEKSMNYTPSSFFNKSIERHIRMKYPQRIFYGDVQLEIDEEGKPYYIRTYGDFVSARNGFIPQGIVMVDPTNGETNDYPLSDIPVFIDGAVSPEAVSLHNSYYGKYIHGFWNSLFGKADVRLPSDEGTEANVSPVFDENGEMYYFTDFTSPKEGVDSMLGYSLTHSRTGEATFYTGNLENSYMDSKGALEIIEKKFIEKQWNGEMPILYNFYGEASWLTPVLDSNGFLQNYFIISAANPEVSTYADTPNAALKKYKTALQRSGSSVDGSSNAEKKQSSGTVVRVYKEAIESFTIVSFLLDNQKNFIVSSETNPLAVYLQEGDNVKVTYLETGEIFLPVSQLIIEGLK